MQQQTFVILSTMIQPAEMLPCRDVAAHHWPDCWHSGLDMFEANARDCATSARCAARPRWRAGKLVMLCSCEKRGRTLVLQPRTRSVRDGMGGWAPRNEQERTNSRIRTRIHRRWYPTAAPAALRNLPALQVSHKLLLRSRCTRCASLLPRWCCLLPHRQPSLRSADVSLQPAGLGKGRQRRAEGVRGEKGGNREGRPCPFVMSTCPPLLRPSHTQPPTLNRPSSHTHTSHCPFLVLHTGRL